MKRLAVIVCTRNRADLRATTLASLAAMRVPAGTAVEVLIVDNNSRDVTQARLQAMQAGWPLGRLHMLFEPRQGKRFALNTGIRHALVLGCDVLAFTDDDILFPVDWLENIDAAFGTDGPALAGGRTELQWPPTGRPNWYHDSMAAMVGGVELGPRRIAPPPPGYAPPGANLVARAGLFDRVGLGFGCVNNLGIEHALREGADTVFLLNLDAYVTSEAIAQLVAFLQTEPGFDIVSPLRCSPDLNHVDPTTQSAYLQRHALGYLFDACLGRVQPHYAIRGINAAAWMLCAEVFRRVGGFDPLFFMYGEDDDLIERFAHHDLHTALLPAARIVHLGARAPHPPRSWARQVAARAERKRSALILELKRPAARLPGQLLRLLSAGIVLPFAELLANRDLQAFMASLLARVLGELARIRRHTRLCAAAGPHFLNLDTR